MLCAMFSLRDSGLVARTRRSGSSASATPELLQLLTPGLTPLPRKLFGGNERRRSGCRPDLDGQSRGSWRAR